MVMKRFACLFLSLMLLMFAGCQQPQKVQLPETLELEPVATVACGHEQGEVFNIVGTEMRIVVFAKFKTVMVIDFAQGVVVLARIEDGQLVPKQTMTLEEAKKNLADPCPFFVSTEV
jgi:hypothetical protein